MTNMNWLVRLVETIEFTDPAPAALVAPPSTNSAPLNGPGDPDGDQLPLVFHSRSVPLAPVQMFVAAFTICGANKLANKTAERVRRKEFFIAGFEFGRSSIRNFS